MTHPLIAPSLLAADFSKLGDEIQAVEKAHADLLHLDIMDGHFVPNLTMGPQLVSCIRRHTKLPFDCHLMIDNPIAMLEPFARAGADWISVHVEASDLATILPKIKHLKCKAGAVLNPATPLKSILPFAALADFILVMTVNPGFAGQPIIESCIEKIETLRAYREEHRLSFEIEVDGGITVNNAARVIKAGADIVVAGSGIFSTPDYKQTLLRLRNPPSPS